MVCDCAEIGQNSGVNANEQTEHLYHALVTLVTAIAKTINQSVEQALLEALPVRLPTGESDRHYHQLLTKIQVAELLNVTSRTVDCWMKRGLLPYYKIGRAVRFKSGDVLNHLEQTSRVDRRGTGTRGRW